LTQFEYTVAQGKVISHYVDEQGNQLTNDEVQSGDLETPWTTKQKEIPGYHFKEVQGNTSGSFTPNDQEVTYIYTHAEGTADVTYIDDTTGETLTNQELSGNINEKSDYSTAETIKNYENKGYELVSDDFPSDGVTFTEDEQHYVVHLKHKIDKDSLSKTVRETIHYVYEDGSKAAEDVFDSAHCAHEIIINRVTGEIVKDNGWTS
ncbi:mucin-binding protein, partial [Enterobacter cloacae complex sp.6701062]|uniref:mucin-binding protein n=1 Tax=Enterobacter cloacae complex sp.6701062 TaxID=3397177 RepID=UPI003AAD70C9